MEYTARSDLRRRPEYDDEEDELLKFTLEEVSPGSRPQDCDEAVSCNLHVHYLRWNFGVLHVQKYFCRAL